MTEFELWINVVGGESDEERCVLETNDLEEVVKAVDKYEDEVLYDSDKYFELHSLYYNELSFTFNSYKDFEERVNPKLGKQ